MTDYQEEAYVLEKMEISEDEDDGFDYKEIKEDEDLGAGPGEVEELPDSAEEDNDEDLNDFDALKTKTEKRKAA